MKIVCLTVGKKHEADFEAAILKYQKRLNSYVDFSFEYLPTADKTTESQQIAKYLKPDDYVILLDETGDLINNQQLCATMEKLQIDRLKRLVFIIGGAYGVDQLIFERSDKAMCLSSLVFPHQLVRLILVEQLYRTFNTIAGGKYHHG